MVTKAMITIWPDNEQKMNSIRGKLLQKGHKLKQSTLINIVLQKYFTAHPDCVSEPEAFIEEAGGDESA